MGAVVAIKRQDLTARALRAAASRERDGAAARRVLALAPVFEGSERRTAAETCGMDRQTLRDWVHRCNAEGVRRLHDRKPPGPRPKLTPEQSAELAAWVEAGPDPERHGVVRWRRVDLRDEIARWFGVALHERSVGKVLVAKDLAIPDNVTLVPLPTYAPELNPMENVWEYLRGNKLAITVFDDYEDIVDKARAAWLFFVCDPDRIASITTRSWDTVTP